MEFSCLQCEDMYTPEDSPSDLYCSEECADEWIDVASDQVCSDDWKLNEEARAARRRLEQAGEIPVVALAGFSSDSYEASTQPTTVDFSPLTDALLRVDEEFSPVSTAMHRLMESLAEPQPDRSVTFVPPRPVTITFNGYDGTSSWTEIPTFTVSSADERTLVDDDSEDDSA